MYLQYLSVNSYLEDKNIKIVGICLISNIE